MQAQSKAIKPAALGTIGREHIDEWLQSLGIREAHFDYKAGPGLDDNGLPQVIEVAFAALADERQRRRR